MALNFHLVIVEIKINIWKNSTEKVELVDVLKFCDRSLANGEGKGLM